MVTLEQIRDAEEDPEEEENDRDAEEYHLCMMSGDHTGRQRSIYEEAEAALLFILEFKQFLYMLYVLHKVHNEVINDMRRRYNIPYF